MEINNYISTINEIYKCLQDDESRALYEARIAYLLERDERQVYITYRKNISGLV